MQPCQANVEYRAQVTERGYAAKGLAHALLRNIIH